jgi:hypothetical protein
MEEKQDHPRCLVKDFTATSRIQRFIELDELEEMEFFKIHR